MPDDKGSTASLRWQIDDQKSECTNIRSETRRYLFGFVSVSLALIVAYAKVDNLFGKLVPGTISQDSLLVQIGVLGPRAASLFTNVFSTWTELFVTLGVGMVTVGMMFAVAVELLERCDPAGNSAEMLSDEEKQLEKWVEHNDEVIDSAADFKNNLMKFGISGVSVVFLSYFAQVMGSGIILFGTIIYFATLYATFRIVNMLTTKIDDWERRLFLSMVFLTIITRPLVEYQEIYGYLPKMYSTSILFIMSVPPLIYLRSDITHIFQLVYTNTINVLEERR